MKIFGALALLAVGTSAQGDESRLDIQFGLTGDGVCDLALDHTNQVRAIVAKNLKVNGAALTDSDIVFYDVAGCNARRRRKTLGASATITVGFSTASPAVAGLDADGFYDAATESLKEAIASITTDFEGACGCTVTVDTIKVELSTLVEDAPSAPEDRGLYQIDQSNGIGKQHDIKGNQEFNNGVFKQGGMHRITQNTGNQIFADSLPAPATTYYAGADCPNGCSGHGSCSTNGCVCWPDWGNGDESGGACDQRICPYEIAFVDTPSAENKAHALRECAGRGVCDRTSGECTCFPGYEGKGCRRTTCPNDCSGHGTCAYISEFRNDLGDNFKWTGNRPTLDQYKFQFGLMWDADLTRGCICDAKWTGLDCSQRMCPRGDYPQYFALEKRSETQVIVLTNVFTPGTEDPDMSGSTVNSAGFGKGVSPDATNGEFALTFRSTLNEEFTTYTLNVYNLTDSMVEDALNSLPNKIIQDITVQLYRNLTNTRLDVINPYLNVHTSVDAGTWYSTDLVILVTYSGSMTSGDQYALECKTAYCGAGCQPMLSAPLDFKEGSKCSVVNNYINAIETNWECSGRGECGEDGVCQCYQGYTDEYCSTRTAII